MSRLSEKLMHRMLPGFKSGHTRYVESVKEAFRPDCRWLDAGGGRRIFHDLYDGERELVAQADQVVVCDVDLESLNDHWSVKDRICCNLTDIPVSSRSFDFITCGMVVEHLAEPGDCLREFGRLLDNDGKLLIHTVNLYGYHTLFAIASRVLPFQKAIIARITGRKEEDIFPTVYRCNTARGIRRGIEAAGLQVVELRFMNAGVLFQKIWPLALIECLIQRLTSLRAFSALRGQILVIAARR